MLYNHKLPVIIMLIIMMMMKNAPYHAIIFTFIAKKYFMQKKEIIELDYNLPLFFILFNDHYCNDDDVRQFQTTTV